MPQITLLQVLKGTPSWVFVLFVVLLALGFLQSRARSVPKSMLALLPASMIALSGYAIVSTFGLAPAAIGSWTLAFGSMALLGWLRSPMQGVTLTPARNAYVVPGSWIPMALIMATFVARYAVTVMVLRDPSLRQSIPFEMTAGFGFGLLSGAFFARVLGVVRAGAPGL